MPAPEETGTVKTLSICVVGTGTVGSALLSQLEAQSKELLSMFNINVVVVGVARSSRMLLGRPVCLSTWKNDLISGQDSDLHQLSVWLQGSSNARVICDCTASQHVCSMYSQWLSDGIHVVTANKIAQSGELKDLIKIRNVLNTKPTIQFLYEASVGAGLPILSTVRNFIRSGDKVLRIEGVLSGTLSYIFSEFDGTVPFSQIVATAKRNGYTEPDPREDLSGNDVARKVVILARAVGIDVELDDVPVRSLVPEGMEQTKMNVTEFMEQLEKADALLAETAREASSRSEVMRYVGTIDVGTGKCEVKLQSYSKSHAFGRLQGTDNMVSFTTQRYASRPLVIQGPGAGADVTAAGVFGDILAIADSLAPS